MLQGYFSGKLFPQSLFQAPLRNDLSQPFPLVKLDLQCSQHVDHILVFNPKLVANIGQFYARREGLKVTALVNATIIQPHRSPLFRLPGFFSKPCFFARSFRWVVSVLAEPRKSSR